MLKNLRGSVSLLLVLALLAPACASGPPLQPPPPLSDLDPNNPNDWGARKKFGALGGGESAKTVVAATANNMTGTSVITGDTILLGSATFVSFQAVWTGTPTGLFSFEASNDVGSGNPTNWTTLTVPATFVAPANNPAGSAGSFIFEFALVSFRWVRPKYTNASGTGTLFVTAELK
jgi:hypothetical protein